MIKKIKTISILLTALLACTLLNAMEQTSEQQDTKLPKLELIEKKKTPGYICYIGSENSDYLLVFKKDKKQRTSKLEIWDKKLTQKVDEITSAQVIHVLVSFQKTAPWNNLVFEVFEGCIHKYMKNCSLIIKKSKVIILPVSQLKIPNEQYDLGTERLFNLKKIPAIQYCLENKTFELIHIDTEDTKDIEILKPPLGKHEKYVVTVNRHHVIIKHNHSEPITIDLGSLSRPGYMFYGNQYILLEYLQETVWSEKCCGAYLYSTKTGKPIMQKEKRFNLQNIISHGKDETLKIQHACFSKDDNCIAFFCNSFYKSYSYPWEYRSKVIASQQIILFDVKKLQLIGQYTFAKHLNVQAIYLSKDEQEIIIASNKDKQIHRFKKPRVTAKDVDEPERRKYILHNPTCPRAKDEKEKIVIQVNGNKIPVDRNLLLLG